MAALLTTALMPGPSLPAVRAGSVPQITTAAAPPASSATPAPAPARPATGCDAQSMLSDPGPAAAAGAACVAAGLESDQAYLVETARPGNTMLHQGPALAIRRLNPMFVHRLAEAISEARAMGLPSAGIFSAYRPPIFGVGRFADKFNSLHAYGLAVDMLGIGGPGSSEAKFWYEIAARHGIICPYGAGNRREWNHCQPTGVKSIVAGDPLRDTVSPRGPIDFNAMFAMGEALINGTAAGAGPAEPQPPVDEKSASDNQGQQPPQGTRSRRDSVETGRDRADARNERHRPLKSIARSAADPNLHEAHGHPKHRMVAENPAGKSGQVHKYRIASLNRHESFAAEPHRSARAKRIEQEHARLDRSIKGICRGC